MRRHSGLALLTSVSLAAGYVYSNYRDLQEACSIDLNGGLPKQSFEAKQGRYTVICPGDTPNCEPEDALATYYNEGNSIPIPLTSMDPDIERAYLPTEDRLFWYTDKADGYKMLARIALRGGKATIRAKDIELPSGGSDLMNQLYRNMYIEDVPENVVCRKVAEVSGSQKLLDQFAGEPDIHGRYPGKWIFLQDALNIFNNGRGAYGIEAAAQAFLGKSANDLTLVEAATLVGIRQNPDGYDGDPDPQQNSREMDNLQRRTDEVLNNMIEAVDDDPQYKTEAERESARNALRTEISLAKAAQPSVYDYVLPYQRFGHGPKENRTLANFVQAEYFVDLVKQRVMKDYGLSEKEFRDGLTINTTLSIDMQAITVNGITSSNIPQDGREIGAVVLGQDGRILAVDGGTYNNSQVNLALAKSPNGSSLKHFVYATAFDAGLVSNLAQQSFIEEDSFIWPGVNVSGTEYLVDEGSHCDNPDNCTGNEALAKSSNKIPLQLMRDMGQEGLVAMDRKMRAYGMDSNSGPMASMVLGYWETSILDLAEGMNGLVANQGIAQPNYFITGIWQRSPSGLIPYRIEETSVTYGPASPTRVDDIEQAAQITEALRGTARYGTASRQLANTETDIACKTGSVPEGKAGFITCTVASKFGNITLSVVMRRVDDFAIPMSGNTNGGNIPADVLRRIIEPTIDQPRSIN
jgi:membrane peptidoglycan carboxypeptidase